MAPWETVDRGAHRLLHRPVPVGDIAPVGAQGQELVGPHQARLGAGELHGQGVALQATSQRHRGGSWPGIPARSSEQGDRRSGVEGGHHEHPLVPHLGVWVLPPVRAALLAPSRAQQYDPATFGVLGAITGLLTVFAAGGLLGVLPL
jgi:hypothetical protein